MRERRHSPARAPTYCSRENPSTKPESTRHVETAGCRPSAPFIDAIGAPPRRSAVQSQGPETVSKSADQNGVARYGRGTGVPDPVDVHVGARIRTRRLLIGMNQETLAKALGATFQQVQKYEGGANRVSASRLSQIADTLGVPISYFFNDLERGGGEPDAGAAEARERLTQQRCRRSRASAAPASGSPQPLRSLKKSGDRDTERVGDLRQSRRADPVGAALVFLHLLKGHRERLGQRLLIDCRSTGAGCECGLRHERRPGRARRCRGRIGQRRSGLLICSRFPVLAIAPPIAGRRANGVYERPLFGDSRLFQ